MRKLFATSAIVIFAMVSAAGAQQLRPVSQETAPAQPPQTVDQQKAQWFAHAIADILSGETGNAGQQNGQNGQSSGR